MLLAIAFVQLIVITIGRGQIGGFSPEVRRWLISCHRFEGYLGFFIITLGGVQLCVLHRRQDGSAAGSSARRCWACLSSP